MTQIRELGFRGRQVLALITTAASNGDRPPSYASIAQALGMNSIADVCNVVRRLERRGLIERRDVGSRYRDGWHNPVIVVQTQTTLAQKVV